MMTASRVWLTVAMLSTAGPVWAGDASSGYVLVGDQSQGEVIVQIGGRHCEYRRSEVEQALRQFDAVQQVEFLNNHGTVRIKYREGAMSPERLAEAVEKALAMGWGCKAWVE